MKAAAVGFYVRQSNSEPHRGSDERTRQRGTDQAFTREINADSQRGMSRLAGEMEAEAAGWLNETDRER